MNDKSSVGGSLQISTEVISKIARIAALEIEGVVDISSSAQATKGILKNNTSKKAINVLLLDEVAEITLNVIVEYGQKVQPLSLKIQENVKSSVQNMTGITVSRVNTVIAGVSLQSQEDQV